MNNYEATELENFERPKNLYILVDGKAFRVTVITANVDLFSQSGAAHIATDKHGQMYGAELEPSEIQLPELSKTAPKLFDNDWMRLVSFSMGKVFEIVEIGKCDYEARSQRQLVAVTDCGWQIGMAKQYSGVKRVA